MILDQVLMFVGVAFEIEQILLAGHDIDVLPLAATDGATNTWTARHASDRKRSTVFKPTMRVTYF